MMPVMTLLAFIMGGAVIWLFHRYKVGTYQKIAQDILGKAEEDTSALQKKTLLEIKQLQIDQQRELERLRINEQKKIQLADEKIKAREEKLELRIQHTDKKLKEIENTKLQLEKRATELEEKNAEMDKELSEISGISSKEAEEIYLKKMGSQLTLQKRLLIKEVEENAEREASRILSTAINRLAVSSVSETTINTVSIPSDDMKGRIIGKEGRNIRCLERETGVNFLIDDTPGAVVLSCFDPVRLHVAKFALQDLIHDGRIHPTRIEEAVEIARKKTAKEIQAKAEDAAMQAGALNLHPDILTRLGQLTYRYSLGQNVLKHSIEVSFLMGMMAAELGLDEKLAKRIGLLHDIGKAMTHELEGSHALIGYHLLRKCGETEAVANGVGCHHHEMEPITVEGSLCSAADSISASRPGARLEAVETYIKRLQLLEKMAAAYPGVERAYALQAGREIRVSVLPDLVDDESAKCLALDLTKRIEEELKYPGKIKITIIREKRIVQYAY